MKKSVIFLQQKQRIKLIPLSISSRDEIEIRVKKIFVNVMDITTYFLK
ncbi:hypothetical protein [Mesoplasma melaleucae]|uniref:Uncharacterized protein n=1 Tax=Mesoplasma melaleucae TaxID=81459 RepID=A0A2K8NX28_9MOLU|nr:hypothetical protein [Mesoplasma melaleucae]ATZ18337.1 hypothetical protein EMELA_v1c08530 [Mesoplasma melaleucae]